MDNDWAIIVGGCLLIISVSFAIGKHVGTIDIQDQAVKNHSAHYNPQTSKFQWINEKKHFIIEGEIE